MAGNGRFELSSASPDSSIVGNYANGQRENCPGPALDRSGSFRESNESRMFGTGKGASRGSNTSLGDLPPLFQMLEPIFICDKKNSKTVELRRALGVSVGSNSEENIFGSSHLKTSPLATMDELKRYRASIADTCGKASARAKKLEDHLHKLNKYCEAVTSKKQQRNDLLSNERSGALGFKIGAQIHRSPSEFVSSKVEERSKNVILNKRVRTSVAETQAEFRNNGQPRQPLPIKEYDMPKDNNADIDVAEEKNRRLPAGGDSWDKRMKKKRSIGVVGSRASDAEMKRPTLHKPSSEPGLQACDPLGLRVGASVGTGAAIKSDGASPAGSNVRAALKKEQEKSILSRDVASGLNKERLLPKASFKLSVYEEIPNALTKGKASHRAGLTATNIVSNIPSVSATLDSWELPPTTNKNPSINGINNRKRPQPTESSSPSIAKWGGQRPQKISRNRRANLVSPVSNHDEGQTSSEGCSPDFGVKLITSGANNSPLSKTAASGSQIIKVKPESVYSPARLSESEDSSASKSKFKEKGTGIGETEEIVINLSNVGSQTILSKSKFLSKEDNPDGVRRQGRSGRVTSVSRVSISPVREKLDNGTVNKPLRQIKHTSDKNGSKTGRPLKKLSDRKGFSRLGLASGLSPDCTWDSEDDREELTSAANMAYSSNIDACSSMFWKTVESVFASLRSEDESYLSEQIRSAEHYCNSFSQMLSQGDDVKVDLVVEEISAPEALSGETNAHIQNGLGREDLDSKMELVNLFQSSIVRAGSDSGQGFDKTIPLYQRVLSALITDDEEFAETGGGSYQMQQNTLWNSPTETHYHVDSESNLGEKMEFELESFRGVQVPKNGTTNRFVGCNEYTNYNRYPNIPDPSCNVKLLKEEREKEHSNDDALGGLAQYNSVRPQSLQEHNGSITPLGCQYEQMPFEEKLLLELQSVGLYLETVPDLHDKEEDEINQEIIQLQRKLYQQTTRKKMSLDKMHKVTQGQDICSGDLEHVAVNKLLELAYKKLLATKGNFAVKFGIPKVSKQVALAFARRTLARCRRFEESGVSCFNEPALREIIYAVPRRVHVEDPPASACKALANGSFAGPRERGPLNGFENFSQQMDHAFAKSGPISNRGKKKEVLLDDFVGDSAFRSNMGCSLSGGAKGKRSDRDNSKDASMKNGFAKAGRSLVNSKGDLKTKTKHKQRTAQLSTSGNGYITHPTYNSVCGPGELIDNNSNRRREVGLTSSAPDSLKDKKESTNSHANDADTIEDLGVESELAGPQDLNSWFNFDIDGLQEDHDAVGLEIPMDDLSELMF